MGIVNYILICLVAFMAVKAMDPPAPFSDHCIIGEQNLYPGNQTAPWYTVNLDDDPSVRWVEVATAYKDGINELIGAIKLFLRGLLGDTMYTTLINWVDTDMGNWDAKFPYPYNVELQMHIFWICIFLDGDTLTRLLECTGWPVTLPPSTAITTTRGKLGDIPLERAFNLELIGIAQATGLPLGEVVLYNIFYEIFTVCTSIVAQDNNNKLYHARNLDFGLFLGWNGSSHDWLVTEKLRKIIININWMKNGQTLYKSVNFAGYIGIYNGVKKGGFTVTANERFNINGGFMGIIQWLLDNSTANFMTLLVRETFETVDTYQDAITKLSVSPIMAPVYYIVGGKNSNEGQIIVRGRADVAGVVQLNANDPNDPNGWYILETNYDPWKAPLYLDDRRTPGNACMQRLTRDNVGFPGIFNVLSSTTNFNKLTAYTVLMQVDEGTLETYIQKCPDPCWAW